MFAHGVVGRSMTIHSHAFGHTARRAVYALGSALIFSMVAKHTTFTASDVFALMSKRAVLALSTPSTRVLVSFFFIAPGTKTSLGFLALIQGMVLCLAVSTAVLIRNTLSTA